MGIDLASLLFQTSFKNEIYSHLEWTVDSESYKI